MQTLQQMCRRHSVGLSVSGERRDMVMLKELILLSNSARRAA